MHKNICEKCLHLNSNICSDCKIGDQYQPYNRFEPNDIEYKQGQFFRFKESEGYSKQQCEDALGLMEVWNHALTLKAKDGCMTVEKGLVELVEDLSTMKNIYPYDYFENNTSR